MNKVYNKFRYSCRSALTLVELIVAVALMVMIIAGIGYVFSSTSKTVRAARAAGEINSSVRALTVQLGDDMRALNKDGFMAIVPGTADTPPIFMFTATGYYDVVREPEAIDSINSAAKDFTNTHTGANSAIIMYTLVKDGHQLSLARYVYRLVGACGRVNNGITGDDDPVFSNLIGDYSHNLGVVSEMHEAMSYGDCMFASLSDVTSLTAASGAGGIYNEILFPFMFSFKNPPSAPEMGWPTITVDPATIDEIDQMWPYILGGLPEDPDAMEVEFYDIDDADCNTWTADHSNGDSHWQKPDEPMEEYWLNVADDMSDLDGSYRNGNGSLADHVGTPLDMDFIIWTGKNKDIWPKALRFNFKIGDIGGAADARDFQIILPVE